MTTEQAFFVVRYFPENGEAQSFKFPGTLEDVKAAAQAFGKSNFSDFSGNAKIEIYGPGYELIATKFSDADCWQNNNEARNLITTVGEVLYGATWQSNLARDLRVNVRTVQRWATGETDLPKSIVDEIISVATSRKKNIENTIEFLKKINRFQNSTVGDNLLTLEDIHRKTQIPIPVLKWYQNDTSIDFSRDILGISAAQNVRRFEKERDVWNIKRRNTPFPPATKTEDGIGYWTEKDVALWVQKRRAMAQRGEV